MRTNALARAWSVLTMLAVLAGATVALAQKTVEPPPNAPATITWDAAQGKLSLRYHGKVIFDGTVRAEDAAGHAVSGVEVKLEPAETRDPKERVEQRLKFMLAKPQDGVKLVLRGTVVGSEEAFPAETGGAAQQRFPLVRNSVGLSRNLRNNAVYDRRWDWELVGPDDGATRITPCKTEFIPLVGKEQGNGPSPTATASSWCSGPGSIRSTRNRRSSSRGPTGCGRSRLPATARGGPTGKASTKRWWMRWWTCSPKRNCPTSATNTSSSTQAIALAPAGRGHSNLTATSSPAGRRLRWGRSSPAA